MGRASAKRGKPASDEASGNIGTPESSWSARRREWETGSDIDGYMIPMRKTGRRNDHFRLPPDRPGCPTRLSCVLPGQVLPWSGDSQGSRFFFGFLSSSVWLRVFLLWRVVNNGGV